MQFSSQPLCRLYSNSYILSDQHAVLVLKRVAKYIYRYLCHSLVDYDN